MMEHMRRDSSGTEDDLPNQDIVGTSRGLLHSGVVMTTSGPVSHETDHSDMKFQIHYLEMEAYGAVLRAFFAQSDSLSWGKESLITDLRKELRVSLDEHSEILGKINSDQSIKAMREWRMSTDAHKLATSPTGFDSNFVGHASCKKLKTGHSTVLSSRRYPLSGQTSPSAIPSAITGSWVLWILTDLASTHLLEEQHRLRKVQVRDNHSSHANVDMTTMPVPKNRQTPISGGVRGPLSVQPSIKGLRHSEFGTLKTDADIIKIRATHMIIHEAEKICGVNPDPVQIQKAKQILREHEKALQEALAKLAYLPDGDESPDQMCYPYYGEEPQRSTHGFHNAAYRKR